MHFLLLIQYVTPGNNFKAIMNVVKTTHVTSTHLIICNAQKDKCLMVGGDVVTARSHCHLICLIRKILICFQGEVLNLVCHPPCCEVA